MACGCGTKKMPKSKGDPEAGQEEVARGRDRTKPSRARPRGLRVFGLKSIQSCADR